MFKLLGVLSGILAALSYIPYTRDILAKKVKPERASWIIWSVLAIIAFSSQLASGARQSLWFTGLDSLGAFLTLALSIKYGLGGLRKRDTIALTFAGLGLIIWYFTHDPLYSLLVTIGVDAIGASLTAWKTFEHPETESYPMWIMVCVAGLLTMISVGTLNATLMVYPFYIFLANFLVILAIFFGRQLKRRSA